MSFAHAFGRGHPLRPSWHLAGTGQPLDDWLGVLGAAPLARRIPVLSYGSNACPSKITWLRSALGLSGPVVVLRAKCVGLAAVWAAGFRQRDGQRPATIAAAPGITESHVVWLATPEQLTTLDACEGRGHRYDLARLHTGTVTIENGEAITDPLVYKASGVERMPLLVDGEPVRCAEVTQRDAVSSDGVPAESDGLDATVLPLSDAANTPLPDHAR